MANRGAKSRSQRTSSRQQASPHTQRSQKDFITSQTRSVLGRYGPALVTQNEESERILKDLTSYDEMGIGAASSKLDILRQQLGATRVGERMYNGKKGMLEFLDANGRLVGAGIFTVIGGEKVESDWELMIPQR